MIPKFRVLDTKLNCLVRPDKHLNISHDGEVSGVNCVVMQSTGRFDLKQVEIFCGDICKYKNVSPPDDASEPVEFIGVVQYYECQWYVSDGWNTQPLFDEIAEITVIGNRYQHSHLLEQTA